MTQPRTTTARPSKEWKSPVPPLAKSRVPAPLDASIAALSPQITFEVGDKAVHPSHGVGEIVAIEHREIGGTSCNFYILKIIDNGLKIMVPTGAPAAGGLRRIMSEADAERILDTLRAREVAVIVQPWSKRFRAYTEMMQSGQPNEIAKVLRDMSRLRYDKELSFGESRLLDQAKTILLTELALAKRVPEARLLAEVRDILSS